MRACRTLLILALLTLPMVLLGCSCGGENTTPEASVDAGAPLGEGVVKEVAGTLADAPADIAEGKGQLLLDVFHGDRAVNRKVKVSLAHDGARDTPAGKGEGNQAFELDPGLYYATIVYSEGDLAVDMSGSIAALKVNAGHVTKYNVHLEAPVGLLLLKCARTDGPGRPEVKVDEQVTLEVFEADGDRSAPMWSGQAGGSVPLPAASYDVKATFDGGSELLHEWFEDLVVAPGMAKTIPKCLFDLDTTGVRIDAFNYSSDINGRTDVYFFNPGANIEVATAKAQGTAGEDIKVDPGSYDVLVVYQPSDDNLDLQGRVKLSEFEVPERGGVRRSVDLQMALGRIVLEVLDGEEDVSERVEMMAKRAGADRVASTSLLEVTGVGEHWLESGMVDVYLTYENKDGEKKDEKFLGIDLGNQFVWRQEFNAQDASWIAAEIERPAQAPRPIAFKPPGGDDDDSAGDDDSAEDDDDSAAPAAE